MLTVNLIDVNDVAPEFSSPFGYVLLVSEDRPINTVISTEVCLNMYNVYIVTVHGYYIGVVICY